METFGHFVQNGPFLPSWPPKKMDNNGKMLDRIRWRVTTAGNFSANCTISPSSGPRPSTTKQPFLVAITSQRTQIYSSKTSGILTADDISLVSRRTRRQDHRERAGAAIFGRVTKVRSSVEEAIAHSADVELNSASVIPGRSDGEAGGPCPNSSDHFGKTDEQQQLMRADIQPFSGINVAVVDEKMPEDKREDGEYGSGVKIRDVESMPSIDYNYEDVKLDEKKEWSMEDLKKLDLLRNFEYRQANEKGVFVVHTMRVEHMKVIQELLVDSFAELMGGLLAYRPLLALTVRQYIQDRYLCLPNVITLVGLYAPAESHPSKWTMAGTVELSFTDFGHRDAPSGPAFPRGSPYLCNMAVSSPYRRRGLGQQLLKAAEKLINLMGKQDLYLHCRLVDLAPLNMYRRAGFQIVATDNILALLTFQRRRHLMYKRVQSPAPAATVHNGYPIAENV